MIALTTSLIPVLHAQNMGDDGTCHSAEILDHGALCARNLVRPSRLESFLVPVTRGCTQGGTPEQNVPQNPPIYFERNIRSMIGIAQAHDIDVMLATWAYQHASPLAFPWWQTAVEEHNDILRALAEEYDTHFIDYAPLAPQDAASWTDYVHMSDAGSRHQAAAFADVLIAEALP